MKFVYIGSKILLLALLFGFAACKNRHGSGGHGDGHGSHGAHDESGHGDHGHDHGEAEEGPKPIRITKFGDSLQLFMEYPPLIKGQKARFLAHFSVIETGEPVRVGRLVIELTKPGAKPFKVTIDEPKRDGLFVPVLEFGSAMDYRAKFYVEGPQITGMVDVGELRVFASQEQASKSGIQGDSEPHDVIPFLMEQQWKIKLRLAEVKKIQLSERLSVPAFVVPPPGGEVEVSIPLPGRLRRSETGAFPSPGNKVPKGEILALLELSPEVASRVKQAQVKREFAERKYKRVSEIRKKGVGSEQQLEQVKEEFELAEAEYRSLLGVSQSVLLGKESGDLHDTSVSIPIVAPVAGEIVSSNHSEGAYLQANEEMFRIVNDETVWLEGKISEFDIARVSRPADSILELDAHPNRQFNIGTLGGRLVNIGRRIDPQSRTVSVRYEMPNPDSKLKVGMFGTMSIATEEPSPRIAMPLSALVYENGIPTAYVMLSGESFQKRELTLGVKGIGVVEVLSGIKDGEWVVADGAYAVKLAASSPASFGHGHAH